MLELTPEQWLELEKRVADKLHATIQDNDDNLSQLRALLIQNSIRATITTIREYEKMQAEQKDPH